MASRLCIRFLPEMGATSLLNTTFVREPVNGGLNFIVAAGWGLLSALSLVIGAWIGITQTPSPKVNASMMAFGGGALIQALSIELFGAILQHQAETGIGCTMAAIAAAVVGGAFFSFLNKVLNDQGAFLRKRATLAQVLRKVSFKDGMSQLDQTRQQIVARLQRSPSSKNIRVKVEPKSARAVLDTVDVVVEDPSSPPPPPPPPSPPPSPPPPPPPEPEPDFEPEIDLEKHENADGPRHNGTLDESTHAQGSHQGAGGHQGGHQGGKVRRGVPRYPATTQLHCYCLSCSPC